MKIILESRLCILQIKYEGYQNIMPSYAGLLTDREISAIIEYIKELK